jgi:hypothetical protein
MEFVEYLFSLAPPRLKTGEWEQRFVTICGELLNMWFDGASYAVRSRFVSDAASDGLGYLGADRVLIRGPNEPDGAWRARIDDAWDVWSWAGSVAPDGLIGHLVAYGFTDGTDTPEYLQSQDVAAPSRASYWSRFWLIIPETCHPYTTTVPDDVAELLRRIIRQFREANRICESVVFITGGGRTWAWNVPASWDAWEAMGLTWAEHTGITLTGGF